MSWAELNIPAPPKTFDPNLDAWITQLLRYLRDYLGAYHHRGDPSAVDFDQTDLTMDAGWYPLDLSSIVPENAKAVVLHIYLSDNNVSSSLSFRKNGLSNTINTQAVRTQVGNVAIDGNIICACDSSRIIEYMASEALTAAQIIVNGWFK